MLLMDPSPSTPFLQVKGIGKAFPGVVALDGVSLEVGRGEVVALCGENGAGKSTLMKILGGVHQPDTGELRVDGQVVKIHNVTDAMRLGIAFIHQELNVLDNLDVAGNVFLGREPLIPPFSLINRRKIHADTEPLLKRLGVNISSRTRLGELSIAQQQMVEIAKALSLHARLIIMDEPTSSLTLAETERLLELISELAAQGVSVIYISHRLGEVDRCAHRVVVLRDGKNAGELKRTDISHDRLVNLMVGRDIKSFYVPSGATQTPRYFRVRNARSGMYPKQSVGFDAGRGEILGFAGLVGAGRSEIVKAIVGLDREGSAEVWLGEQKLALNSARDAIEHGMYLVPEDRRGEGLVVRMSIRENITLPSLRRYAPGGLIRREREDRVAREQIAALQVKTPGPEAMVRNLSGGNQQKVVLSKWLAMDPKVMILDEPTRGIDVGAKAEIYKLMRSLAAQGGVILMISSDMEEILHVSDRILVMHEGRVTGMLERADCTEERIMQLAVGREVAAARPAFTN
jgi:ribose transport system ATP-binding protein